MYDTFLHIAHDIIIIGGALVMILGFILLIMLIVLTARIHHVVSKTKETITMISQYVILPFTYLASFLSKKPEDDEQKEERKRKTSTSRSK